MAEHKTEPTPRRACLGPDGAARIAIERERQKAIGYTAEHDAEHSDGCLAQGACTMILARQVLADIEANGPPMPGFPAWAIGLALKHRLDRVRQLEIAGALIAAELDRVLRLGLDGRDA